MNELENACNTITSQTGNNIICINGLFCDPEYDGRIRVSVLATGLEMDEEQVERISKNIQPSAPKELPEIENYGQSSRFNGLQSLSSNLDKDKENEEEDDFTERKKQEDDLPTDLPPFLNLLD